MSDTCRAVTERDFRAPEFINADPADYEFRADGKIVRKDRWENGIRRIAGHIGWSRREFEIDDLVAEVEKLIPICCHGYVCTMGDTCTSDHK